MKMLRPISAAFYIGLRQLTCVTLTASALLAMAAVTASPVFAMSQEVKNSVEKVEVKQVDGNTVIHFMMKEKITAIPKNFFQSNPSKIVFDFENTSISNNIKKKELVDSDVTIIQFIQASDLSRAILTLKSDATYQTRFDEKSLFVTVLSKKSESQNEVIKSSIQNDVASVQSHGITAIDFRRGSSGEGKIIIDLADASVSVDIKQQGQQLILEFMNASLPDALRKKLNVVDFGTPVQTITTLSQGSKTKMIIDPKGSWEFKSYQADKRLVVEVKTPKVDAKVSNLSAYKGDKLTLNFQNIEVRALLNVIADYTKLNIIASDTVQGMITLHLQEVPWDQALDIILQARGLDMRRTNNVIIVAPIEELAKREKDILDVATQISDTEPVVTESFQLNYTSTADMIAILTNDKQRILSKRGSAVVDVRTNQIFIQDIPSRILEAAKIIKKVDIAMRQVQIEARIVEAGDKFSQNIGARLGFNSTKPFNVGGTNASVGGGLASTGAQSGQTNTVADFVKDGLSVNLPATSQTGSAAGVLSMVLFNNAATRFLNLELSALEADGRGKIISSPRVVTADQKKALIEQGVEIPYQEASSSGAATVSFKKANLRLAVKPHITPDGNVIMEVEINKDAPGTATASGIAIDTKHISTEVMIENGGTVVIGGIYTQDERTDVSKIPFLGDIPFAGALFRNKVKQDTKTELLIFLTPRILDDRIGGQK
jgi:type IV pilus assembly protein PilQ